MIIERSDGYRFEAVGFGRKMRITAGCRDFGVRKACRHWCNLKHHKHFETTIILGALFRFRGLKAKHIPKKYRAILGYE